MPRILLLCAVLLPGAVAPVHAITHITTATMPTSATWGPSGSPADNEYWVEPASGTTFTVPSGLTLTIQPGTTVRLAGGVSLIVDGSLSATGTAPSPMLFDVTPPAAQWGGITVTTAGSLSLDGCTIQDFGTYPVQGTIPQVAGVFAANTFVARADGRFNAIQLHGSQQATVTTSVTLSRPAPGFCYITDSGALVIAGAAGPVLTIADGTVIKFTPGNYLLVALNDIGGLRARGVVFTSSQDDTLGDTNGNGPTMGAPNQWRNLRFQAGTLAPQTVVDSCTIRYAGDTDGYGVLVSSAEPTLTRCVIERNQGIGLYVSGSSSAQQISGNLLRNSTTWELSAVAPAMANLVPSNTVELSSDGRYNGYQLQGGTIKSSITLPRPPAGFCYITDGFSIVVTAPAGPVLTIASGTVIKFAPSNPLQVAQPSPGGLRAKGVVFTSSQDDTLGDTNGNGPSVGAPNQWRGLRFESGTLAAQTLVDSCVIRYAGVSDGYAVRVSDAEPTLTRCVIEKNQGIGMSVDGSSSAQQISGNLLRNNTTWELSAQAPALANLIPNNTVEPSADGRYNGYQLQGSTIVTSMTLPKPAAGFCYILNGAPITVAGAGGPVLTIADGTLLKFMPTTYLLVAQSSTGGLRAKGVVFTSSQDDTLGDTNGDGPSVGAPNQWRNLRFDTGTLGAQTVVDGCVIRYGGDTDGFGVLVRDADPTLTNCVVERNQGIGLYVTGGSSALQIVGNLLRNNATWELSATAPALANLVPSNSVQLSSDGRYNGYQLQGSTVVNSMTLPKPAEGFCYLLNGSPMVVAGAGGPVLTIADGTVIKFTPATYLLVAQSNSGGLRARGVVFTSSQDDTLGDTNGNGFTAGAPSQWRNLRFETGTFAGQTVVDSCVIRYAGDTDGFGVLVRNAEPTLSRCVIEKNQGFGLYVDGSSSAQQITGNLLRSNTAWELSATLGAMTNLAANNTVLPPTYTHGRYYGYHVNGGSTVGSQVLPRPAPGMPYYLAASTTVPAGSTLSISPGAILKMGAGVTLNVTGTLLTNGKLDQPPYDPIVMTSYRDDATWGDTNGDGSSTPAPADWQGIVITGANNASVLRGVMFEYGGAGGLGHVSITDTGAQATPNVLVANCQFGAGTPVLGIRTLRSNPRIDSCSFYGPSAVLGVSNLSTDITIIAQNCWWGSSSGPFDPVFADPCTNPGGTGVAVSDFVDYCPFLTQGTTDVPSAPPSPRPITRSAIVSLGPVPSAGSVTMVLDIASGVNGRVDVMDIAGRKLRTFDLGGADGRSLTLQWDGRGATGGRVPPGVYLVRYRHEGGAETRRVIMSR
jgi:nitrous oxidase accessory protein NosD